jgi:hypothetical protein
MSINSIEKYIIPLVLERSGKSTIIKYNDTKNVSSEIIKLNVLIMLNLSVNKNQSLRNYKCLVSSLSLSSTIMYGYVN